MNLTMEGIPYIQKPVFSDKVLEAAGNMQVVELSGLTTRTRNSLLRRYFNGVTKTVADLYRIPDEEILRCQDMGPKRLSEINTALAAFAEQVEQNVSCA